ncbi:Holliday junction DNA helicase RuvA [Bathymodiolus thermophilus thioautotrophic gill symbiont]|uniref:Holliday junction branch migration complex subunit RuvA n=1 Tax=Bathymodiolus thermophilus thioautotrophic gill symbiont TaxID=2360 RepID=A0A1J5U5M6_9GAMM|nr:Holliday junction branch migration protein RuvA [Bathymodiolus thermophilus thioautotrophic gill symbiont]AYQ57173.1 Holliday junction ATP-dependent DNA helicase RuvA [Bathymodiolus thermophilus thioautotrophic gill symbiont]OIR24126.1 Holliday junction DNA helicase RuvA [Bathymodiolus thermophilus thioautotrophic gill symbiont]CAB5498245.1 Holliday junction ATP-dependent DNA helicase RuvA (EC [Bathymodiolus thermophilus thioautotrophic gill symbiont]CAB5500491.1 Holliday junction ATP-depend
MIGKLTGVILDKNPPEILLDVAGIGYEILCPMSSFYAMGDEKQLSLYTHLSIKEDAHTLYGFVSKDEKTLFRELIRVNGIGPKVALAILSHLDIVSLMSAVANEDDILLAKTPGIGKKTAQKLIVELKDRLVKLELSNSSNQVIKPSNNPNISKALSALQALGFKAKEAEKMLSVITDYTLSTEELIRQALKNK